MTDIKGALQLVAAKINSDDAYAQTFRAIEEQGLGSASYRRVIEQARRYGFSAHVAAEFLNILVHSYEIDSAIVGDARQWIFDGDDPYLIEIGLRLHLSVKGGFFVNRRLRKALKKIKQKFPSLTALAECYAGE